MKLKTITLTACVFSLLAIFASFRREFGWPSVPFIEFIKPLKNLILAGFFGVLYFKQRDAEKK